jgi:hypothetical protein
MLVRISSRLLPPSVSKRIRRNKDASYYPRPLKAELYSQLADPWVNCRGADNAER